MYEFVLNRLVELVKSGVCFNQGFKESQMKKVANDVLDFTSIAQIYNHIRKWRNKWSLISILKCEDKLKWSEYDTCFVLDDEENLYDHLKVIKLTHAFMLFFHPC
jgi:hypothetical protein